jgi:hypothetical protein
LGCVLKNPPISVFSDASDIRIIISIAQVLHNCALNLMIALWGQEILGGVTPMEVQHILAKLHLRKR